MCFIACTIGLTAFLGLIYLSSIVAGHSLESAFPEIPWSQLMNWEKIAEIFSFKSS
jgi:hypothetical protein